VSNRLSMVSKSAKRFHSNRAFNRLCIAVLVVCIVCALVSTYLMLRLDTLIHVRLYDFGLQFDRAWADVYYFYAYAIYAALALPIALSLLTIAIGIKIMFTKTPEPVQKMEAVAVQSQPKLQEVVHEEPKPVRPQPQSSIGQENKLGQSEPQSQAPSRRELQSKIAEETSIACMICPACGKKFSKALLMLDFEGGKSKLVKVCPYCSFTLGEVGSEQQLQSEFQILDADKKLAH